MCTGLTNKIYLFPNKLFFSLAHPQKNKHLSFCMLELHGHIMKTKPYGPRVTAEH